MLLAPTSSRPSSGPSGRPGRDLMPETLPLGHSGARGGTRALGRVERVWRGFEVWKATHADVSDLCEGVET